MRDGSPNLTFFRQMFRGAWITQAIWVAAELGIADLVADGPQTVDDLARKTTPKLKHYTVCCGRLPVSVSSHKTSQLRFSSTPLAHLLRSDTPGTQRSFAIMMGGEFHAAWGELLFLFERERPGFQKRFGVPLFQYMTEHPERHGYLRRGHEVSMGGKLNRCWMPTILVRLRLLWI